MPSDSTSSGQPDNRRVKALVEAGAAGIALAEAWERFWQAVRALEEANRGE